MSFRPPVRPLRFQKLTFLGTSSAIPTKTRNVSGAALSCDDGTIWLFDCGEGIQHQFLHCPLTQTKISNIFVTHMHGDHCFGLPGLLCTMSMGKTDKAFEEENPYTAADPTAEYTCADAPEEAPADVPVVNIYGPYKLGQFLRTSLRLSYSFMTFRYRVHEAIPEGVEESALVEYMQAEAHLNELRPRLVPLAGDGTYTFIPESPHTPLVLAAPLRHAPGVFCIGYSMTEPVKPGKLDVQELQRRGVPKGPMFNQLKNGQSVTLPDGTKVKPVDVVGPAQRGRRIVILGDTCDSTQMLSIGRDADLLVHEATYDDATAELAEPRGHSTARMAGAFAKLLNARKLILTHFSARFCASSKAYQAYLTSNPGVSQEYPVALKQAVEAHVVQPLVDQAMDSYGRPSVVAAHDLMEVVIAGDR
mmetsp:Transcript_90688/g.157195  ORF Transcript_90688/g.157195 Transcript_90688/m.157195 type:complete len:418 (-) Transcript_90688:202-1455(-)